MSVMPKKTAYSSAMVLFALIVALAVAGCGGGGGKDTGSSGLPDQVVIGGPANGATNISINPTISWLVSANATRYSVSFGTDPVPAFVMTTTGTTYQPTNLQYNTTYYWQIDAENSAGVAPGLVWNFKTRNNLPPVFQALGAQTVDEGALLTFTVSATDPEGDAVSYFNSTLPSGASFDTGTGIFNWTPALDQAGSYAVTFTASSNLLSASIQVAINVINSDRSPVLVSPGNRP